MLELVNAEAKSLAAYMGTLRGASSAAAPHGGEVQEQMCARRAGRHRVGGAGALPSRQQPNERSGCAVKPTWPFTWLQQIILLAAGTAHGIAGCG